MKRDPLEHVVVLASYSLLAIALSYPLVLNLAGSIPGIPGDVWSYVWAMGWARSGLELGVNPFRNDYIFYPLGGATQLLWATALPSFASLPLQFGFGLIPAFNLVYLLSTVLTGYGTYLLARDLISSGVAGADRGPLAPVSPRILAAAFVAGAAFAFAPLRLGYGLAFTNLYHTEFIPFFAFFLLRAVRRMKRRDALLAGLMLALNAYIDFQIAAFLALFALGVAAVTLARTLVSNRRWAAAQLAQYAIAGATGILLVLPMAAVVQNDLAAEGGNYVRVYPLRYSADRSYDVLSYLLPNARSTFYKMLPVPHAAGINAPVSADGESHLSPDRQSFLGLTVVVLALIGLLRAPRPAALWAVSALLFILLSFGPTLHLAGQDLGLPLPYAALHDVPLLNHIRIPMRYGLMAVFAVSILAGLGIWNLSGLVRAYPLAVISTALVLAESAVLPYPTLPWQPPSIYRSIAQEQGDFSILEVPGLNWRAAAAAEVFQTIHGKRLLRAYTNRIAPDIADYFSLRQTPIVTRSLRILEGVEEGPLSEEELAQDAASLDRVQDFFRLRYVIVHAEWLAEPDLARIEDYLQKTLHASIVSHEGTTLAYRLEQPTNPGSVVDLSLDENISLLNLGRGWQTEPMADQDGEQGRYMTGDASEFYFPTHCESPVGKAASHCVVTEMRLRAFGPREGTVLQLDFDGRFLPGLVLHEGWADYSIPLPPDLKPVMHRMRLIHPGARIAVSEIQVR